MSNVSQFLGGASAGMPTGFIRVFETSGFYVARKDGEIRITGVGAGASGAAVRALVGGATGGSGPGFLPPTRFKVKAGDVFEIIIGAGGDQALSPPSDIPVPGNDGGITTISGPGVDITIEGGKGGVGAVGPGTVIGPLGGSVLGAVGLRGAKAGDVFIPASPPTVARGATGGGVANVFGIVESEFRSGDVTLAVPASGSVTSGATGGAAPGGSSVDSVATSDSPSPSPNTVAGPGSQITLPEFVKPSLQYLLNIVGVGTVYSSEPSEPGGATGGGSSGSAITSASAPKGFGGTGGTVNTANSGTTGNAQSGSAGVGSSSGGAIGHWSGTRSGAGGPGFVIIEEL